MSELLKAMANLTDEEQALVLKIIKGMDSNSQTGEAEEKGQNVEESPKTPLSPPKRTQKGKRGVKKAPSNAQNKRIIIPGDSGHQAPKSKSGGRSGPVGRKGRASTRSNGPVRRGDEGESRGRGNKKGMACHSEPLQISGHNNFLDMEEFHEEKQDVEIDKKLNKGRKPTRRYRKLQKIEVECQGTCGYIYEVSQDVLMVDPDTHEYLYTCNDCASSRR